MYSKYKGGMAIAAALVLALGISACGGGGGSSTPTATAPTPQERCEAGGGTWANGACTTAAELRTAATNAVAAAKTAVDAVMDDSNAATVSAADTAIANAEAAVMAASGHGQSDLDIQKGRLAEKKTSRTAYMDKMKSDADKMMMATAMKLRAGISARSTDDNADQRNAAYSGTNDSEITVTIGTGENNTQVLKATKATVADNHGWKGKAYADPAGGDSYVAHVYSNVGKPKQGAKFNSGTGDGNVGFTLENGAVTISSGLNTATRISGSSFDHSAGYKTFKLPDPNPGNASVINISGSYYGVSGTYNCTPTTPADGCRVNRAAEGYTLQLDGAGGGAWTFKPNDATARVTEMPDNAYASYGWWLKKSADGKTYTASAFTDNKGTAPTALEISALRGKATYMGGAAGKYALYSTTGGTNDAGHFTARATLSATFAEDHTIEGTIDNFMGVGGAKNWSVKLNKTDIGDTGVIDGVGGEGGNVEAGTVWTIGETAAAKSGQWRGNLQEAGDDGVPAVATGTFFSHYGNDGRMVGAFGANKQ